MINYNRYVVKLQLLMMSYNGRTAKRQGIVINYNCYVGKLQLLIRSYKPLSGKRTPHKHRKVISGFPQLGDGGWLGNHALVMGCMYSPLSYTTNRL